MTSDNPYASPVAEGAKKSSFDFTLVFGVVLAINMACVALCVILSILDYGFGVPRTGAAASWISTVWGFAVLAMFPAAVVSFVGNWFQSRE